MNFMELPQNTPRYFTALISFSHFVSSNSNILIICLGTIISGSLLLKKYYTTVSINAFQMFVWHAMFNVENNNCLHLVIIIMRV